MDIQEKKTLLKLLSDYQDETMLKARRWNSSARRLDSLIDNPYMEKSTEIAKISCYLSFEIAESTL